MTKDYWAIKDSWFAIENNQLFCLLGPNGAGKVRPVLSPLLFVLSAHTEHGLAFNTTAISQFCNHLLTTLAIYSPLFYHCTACLLTHRPVCQPILLMLLVSHCVLPCLTLTLRSTLLACCKGHQPLVLYWSSCVASCYWLQTTTINCLTGVIPASGGDALVYGEALSSSGGMDRIRSMMGVCPQFDVLWSELTGLEHLTIYGNIKVLAMLSRLPYIPALHVYMLTT